MRKLVLVLSLLCPPVWGHSLIPMRLEADSGTKTVIAMFTLTNRFNFQDRFAIDCYKGERGYDKIECQSIPESIILSPNAARKVKVRMSVDGDGLYRICSIEDPDENEQRYFITRLCAIVGVGVSPYSRPSVRSRNRATANAMATGAGSNSLR